MNTETLFGVRLTQAMQLQGITVGQLALQSGCSESGISRYMKGKRMPRADRLQRIVAALGISADWLLGFNASLPFPT